MPFPSIFELSSLNGSNGFTLNGINAANLSGYSVSSAGDVNGDGVDDLIIGAHKADPSGRTNAGQSYVVFGKTIGFSASLELSSLDGSNGFTLNGINAGDFSGYSVSRAGDVNGDGVDDLLIGAREADPSGRNAAGQSYVVFGKTTGFSASLELSSLDGSNGFTLNGGNANDFSGYSVSSAGDVNGDGVDDLIIGAPYADPGGRFSAGQSYVVFGKTTGFSASLDLSSLDGSNGFTLNGINVTDGSGNSVSSAGDVNGDGVDDLIIGAERATPSGRTNAGQSYVVFGKTTGFSASLELSSLDGSNGFTLNGSNAEDSSGFSVSRAGDVNGDGVDDLIIGAFLADPSGRTNAGQSYVVFGKTTGFSASLELSSLNGSNGFILNGSNATDFSGFSVSRAGDVNGDGVDDLIIGAFLANPSGRSDAGQSYVVFGKTTGFSASLELSSLNGSNGFTLNGINDLDSSGFSVSRAGDVNGDGVDDLIIGAYLAAPGGRNGAGQSYVVFGQRTLNSPDFTQDGKTDILWRNYISGENGYWEMNGTTFVTSGLIDPAVPVNSGWDIVGTGDFTGDGQTDILWRNYISGENGYWEMDGTTFVTSGLIDPIPVNSGWDIVGTGDFTNDGKVDILWRNRNTGENGYWEMDGAAVVTSGLINPVIPVNSGWDIVGAGDFTGDGETDIVWHNRITGDSGYWEMDGTQRVKGVAFDRVPVETGWYLMGAGDFNQDGSADLFWQNYATGDTGFWLMQGATRTEAIAAINVGVNSSWTPVL